ncbi:MAG: T9SS C-terminal target domain-containing protein [Cytophagales bacterium]|nr:MAG: T9SS C-terminal target domain-containing protein [Cytophagales bacterium]
MKKKLLLILAALPLLNANLLNAQNLPKGFSIQKVCDLQSATCEVFAPDGRIFIGEQDGRVLIVEKDKLLAEPAITIPNVESIAEKGLLGMAIDPDFNNNKYLYVFYTRVGPGFSYDLVLDRYTINGNKGEEKTEILFMGTVNNRWEIWNHNGGGIRFGNDGKLYIAVGYNDQDARIQDLNSYLSKIIRINKDGSAPTDNPYYSENGSNASKRIYAYGLRNPFTLHFLKNTTNTMLVTDVSTSPPNGREEINFLETGGKDLGFPNYNGVSGDESVLDPIFTYNTTDQNSNTVETINGCAITGATTFYPENSNYPSEYKNKIFFMDFCNGWMSYLTLDGNTVTRKPFATGLGKFGKGSGHLGLEEGVDGNLYFITRFTRTPEQNTSLQGNIDPQAKAVLNRIVFDASVSVEESNRLLLNCTVQPNPASTVFSVNLISDNSSQCDVKIYDVLGKLKQSNNFQVNMGENEFDIDINSLSKGTYMISIKNDNRFANKKLVVE